MSFNRQQWRHDKLIENRIPADDFAPILACAEAYVFAGDVVVPVENKEQRQAVINAVQGVIANYNADHAMFTKLVNAKVGF